MKTLGRPSRWTHQLSILEATVQSGSVSAAAARLGMTTRDVSRALRSLEAAMDTLLFTRTREGIEPTQAGEILYSALSNGISNIRQHTGRLPPDALSRGSGSRAVRDSLEHAAATVSYLSRPSHRRRNSGARATSKDD